MFRDVFSAMWNGHPCLEGLWLVWFILETHFLFGGKTTTHVCPKWWWNLWCTMVKTKLKLHLYPHSRSQEWLILAIVVLWLSIVGGFNPQPIWKMWGPSNWMMKPHRVEVKLSRKGAHLPLEPLATCHTEPVKRMCFATGKSLATRHNKCDFYAILGDMFTFYEVEVCFYWLSILAFRSCGIKLTYVYYIYMFFVSTLHQHTVSTFQPREKIERSDPQFCSLCDAALVPLSLTPLRIRG